MKILLLANEFPPEQFGGIATCMATIAPALVKRGHEVHLLCCRDEQDDSDYSYRGVHVHRRRSMKIRGARRAFGFCGSSWFRAGLTAFVGSRRLGASFDVIDHQNWGADGWVLSLIGNRPTVCTVYTGPRQVPEFFETLDQPKRSAWWGKQLELCSVRGSDCVVTSSHLMAEKARSMGVWRGDFRVIPRPVEWQRWKDIPSASGTSPNVLFIGRIEPRKAPEVLVQAIGILRREVPKVRAIFAGAYWQGSDGGIPKMPWVQKQLAFDACEFLGYLPDEQLKGYIEQARVIAQPSEFESFGLVPIEAMAAGRPTIITMSSGAAGLVKKFGGGAVIPPADPKALADALRPFLLDAKYASQVGESARQAVRSELDPDLIAAETEKVYEEACRRFRGRVLRRWSSKSMAQKELRGDRIRNLSRKNEKGPAAE
jgi:glycogen(starch) synthase